MLGILAFHHNKKEESECEHLPPVAPMSDQTVASKIRTQQQGIVLSICPSILPNPWRPKPQRGHAGEGRSGLPLPRTGSEGQSQKQVCVEPALRWG